MITVINLINFAAAVAGLMAVLLGLVLTLSVEYIERQSKRFFIVLFVLLIAYIASDLLTQLQFTFLHNDNWQLSKVFLFCESLFSSMLMPLLTLYILHCAGEGKRNNGALYTVVGLWLAYFILLVITQFTDEIYYITADNVYHRGPWYPVLLVPPVLLMLTNLLIMYRRRAALTSRQKLAIASYLIIPLICMIIQMVSFGLLMIVIGTSAASLCMFIFILVEQMERYIKQREKILTQETSITVLQMRPHFIYNTLTSIYYLCTQDPVKAQQVTLDFTTYLRNNFTAIASDGDIPFRDELEHTRAYLSVEKAQFEDKLYVEFDTPHINFRVPPLTLQPIVENAIKHGLNPDLDPLYISVSTRLIDGGSEIIVEDTGLGFSPSGSGKPHIALENIRRRLESISGGTLTIEPRKAGGTKVTIFVPYRKTSE